MPHQAKVWDELAIQSPITLFRRSETDAGALKAASSRFDLGIANEHRITKAFVLDAYVSNKLLKSVPNGKSVVISNSH